MWATYNYYGLMNDQSCVKAVTHMGGSIVLVSDPHMGRIRGLVLSLYIDKTTKYTDLHFIAREQFTLTNETDRPHPVYVGYAHILEYIWLTCSYACRLI